MMLNPHVSLDGRTAIVTGASRGIGAATARRLAAAGANVALLARSGDAITRIADEIGAAAIALPCDMSDPDMVRDAFVQVVARFGGLDILVNNAGIIDPIARIEDAEARAWAAVVDTNLKGVFYAVNAALPLMKRGDGGTIVNISSGAANAALEGWSHYCATKAAVKMLTACVHKEEAGNGIRCVGLSPGTVATDMQRQIRSAGINPVSKLDWSAHIPAEWAAEAVLWLTGDAARDHDGTDFSIKTDAGRRAVGLPIAA